MRRRWLALVAAAPFALACGTLLGIDPDPTTAPGPDGGEPGEGGAITPDAAPPGDAVATDSPSEACVADCGVPLCAGSARACPLDDGGMHCVDAQNDDQNCGACGHICNIAGSCVTGDCARRVFVTSGVYMVGGNNVPHSLAAADAICQGVAMSRGLKNTFRAWMSDSSQYPADGTRFTQSTQPYKLMNGTTVAASFGGLMSGSLMAAIDIDESGGGVGGGGLAWTGTRVDGQRAPAAHCTSWSDNMPSSSAFAGDITAMGSTWTESSLSCDSSAHLYCFEQ